MQTSRFSALSAFAALFLTACTAGGSSYAVTYDLSFQNVEAAQVDGLTNAAMRVVERRLDAMGVVNPGKEFGKDAQPSLIITVPDKEGADELTRQLTAPFMMKVMKETPVGETPDLDSQTVGKFSDTDIATADFAGVEAGADSKGIIGARILMTPEGIKKLQSLYKEQQGKQIGIFARDRLVTKIAVTPDMLDDDKIVIVNIPNRLQAEAFMDDVNVGLHVVYTPKP